MIDLDYIYENLDKLILEDAAPSFPLDICVKSAEDSYVVDTKNNKYLDLTSNLDSQPFGYSFLKNDLNLQNIADSGLFKLSSKEKLKKLFYEITGLDEVIFSSSQEQNYSILSDLIKNFAKTTDRKKVLVSCTDSSKNSYTSIKNKEFLPLNNDSPLKTFFTKDIAAVIIQLNQISEEIIIAADEYLKEARALCHKHNAILIFDVSNVAPYRTSKGVLNYNPEICPDVLLASKGISNGLPVSCFCHLSKFNEYLSAKYSCDSFVFEKTLSRIISNSNEYDIPAKVRKVSELLINHLEKLVDNRVTIGNVDDNGLLITFDTDYSANKIQKMLFEKKVIVKPIGANRVLLSPPYSLVEEDIQIFINALGSVIDDLSSFDKL